MLTNKTLFLILLLSLSGVCLFSPAVQSQPAYEDFTGELFGKVEKDITEVPGDVQNFEDPLEEQKGVRTLEQESNEHGIDWHSWAVKVAAASLGSTSRKTGCCLWTI